MGEVEKEISKYRTKSYFRDFKQAEEYKRSCSGKCG